MIKLHRKLTNTMLKYFIFLSKCPKQRYKKSRFLIKILVMKAYHVIGGKGLIEVSMKVIMKLIL